MHQDRSVPPVFVGGTGRSGTTIVGELIGASEAYVLVPIELRFHVDQGGLGDLAQDKVSVEQFEETMRRQWYRRPPNKGGPRGAHVILSPTELDAAFDRLRTSEEADRWGAAGTFLNEVIEPLRLSCGAQSWVEMTPPNAKRANLLARMVPSAKFIHMVRDGRDVASSVVRRAWGPNDMPGAIVWWGNQMKAAQRSMSVIDPSRTLTLRLESLVGEQRESAYEDVQRLLGIDDDDQMRAFFESNINSDMSHGGRWRGGLTEREQHEVESLYAVQLKRLELAGTPMPLLA